MGSVRIKQESFQEEFNRLGTLLLSLYPFATVRPRGLMRIASLAGMRALIELAPFIAPYVRGIYASYPRVEVEFSRGEKLPVRVLLWEEGFLSMHPVVILEIFLSDEEVEELKKLLPEIYRAKLGSQTAAAKWLEVKIVPTELYPRGFKVERITYSYIPPGSRHEEIVGLPYHAVYFLDKFRDELSYVWPLVERYRELWRRYKDVFLDLRIR